MSYVSSEHYKYARYYSLDEHSSVPEVLLMAKPTWDKLNPGATEGGDGCRRRGLRKR